MPSSQRTLELDGLRAVAVASVMAFHYWRPSAPAGFVGVDTFFVLSGFLITGIICRQLEQGRFDYRAFLVRRARRLAPGLAAVLLVCLLLAPALLPWWAPRSGFDAAIAALSLTNLREVVAPRDNPLSHTWSLAIESQFYLLFPAALIAARGLSRRLTASVLLALWAAITLARLGFSMMWPTHPAPYYATPFHATGLLLGAALALHPPRLRLGPAGLASLVAIAVLGARLQDLQIAIPLAELAAAAVILDPPRILAWRPAVWLGAISYGVYLWHIPVMHVLFELPVAVRLPGETILTLVLAAASFLAIEKRFMTPAAGRPARPSPAAPVDGEAGARDISLAA
jgi:peptidoglycan/LPS O-acetylase OafA/YrhL